MDLHQYAALGAIVKKGKFMDSYLEVGFGRTDLFGFKSKDRWKVDGMLLGSGRFPDWGKRWSIRLCRLW